MTNEKQTKTNTKASGARKQTRNAKIQETEPTNESSKGVQQDEQQVNPEVVLVSSESEYESNQLIDISPFITNEEGNIYAITGLPEEFIATLFAWVSRSPKSFKEHLRQAIKDFNIQEPTGEGFDELSDKAKKFHEKWTVGYGHSSVAENAVAHVGIEGISRLTSAELELSNTFLSITEYSQRYQKPERGKWHNPFSSFNQETHGMLHEDVEHIYSKSFDVFEQLIEGVYVHLMKDVVNRDEKEYKQIQSNMMKWAFEDARYVLPLAMHTQLGMTANGRAWRDALSVLGNSDHQESIKLAEDIRTEVTKVLPVLLKYAAPSQYQRNSKKRMKDTFKPMFWKGNVPKVKLHTVPTEQDVMLHTIALLIMKNKGIPYHVAHNEAYYRMAYEEREHIIKELLFEMQHFDAAPAEFNHVRYSADLLVSEANWHQLLRHNRKTDFTFSNPSPHFGITIPPRIVEAGLQQLVKDIAGLSEELYNKLVESGFEKEAEYVVLNAHKRLVHADFSLAEAYHLINLRTSPEAQWDIRETFEELYKQLNTVHPLLMSQAKRRL